MKDGATQLSDLESFVVADPESLTSDQLSWLATTEDVLGLHFILERALEQQPPNTKMAFTVGGICVAKANQPMDAYTEAHLKFLAKTTLGEILPAIDGVVTALRDDASRQQG